MSNARADLERYLRFEVSLGDLRSRLGPNWHFERDNHSFELIGDVALAKPVEIDFEHIRNAVNLALREKIPAGALEEWANLLLLSDAYGVAAHLDENQRERLLQCLHELASPSVFGGFDGEHLLELRGRAQG